MNGNFFKGKNIVVVIAIIAAIVVGGMLCSTAIKNAGVGNKTMKEGSTANMTESPVVAGNGDTRRTAEQTGTVTVYYVDEEGNNLTSEPTVKRGAIGEWYEVERINIPKYTKAGEDPITKAGYYEAENKNVVFVYKSAENQVSVEVNGENESNSGKNEVNAVFNNTKVSTDYGVKLIAKDQNGNSISGGKFEISKSGDALASGELRNGEIYFGKIAIGTAGNIVYGIEQKQVASGYKGIDGKIGLTLNSTWLTDTKKYKIDTASTDKEGTTVTIDEEKKEIIIEVINEKIADMYEMEIIYRNDNEIVKGATVKVEKDSQTIKEENLDTGKLGIRDIVIDNAGTDTYYISETKSAEGFESALANGKRAQISVVKTFNGAYSVSASSNTTGVETEVVGNKVFIYVSTKPVEEEKKEKYDLAIMKFVSEIDGEETDKREPKVTVNKDGKKFSYSKSGELEKVANNQKVTYILRMYNESEEDGKGKRVIEEIPEGLVYLPDDSKNQKYGWKGYVKDKDGDLVAVNDISKATVVATDYLVGKEISGYNKTAVENAMLGSSEASATDYLDFVDVEVVFKVDESKIKNEERIIENVVRIQKNDNDDNTDNDITSEKLYVKYFDLSVKKYIEEINVKNDKEEKTIKVGESKKGETVKVDVAKSQINNTTVTVTYGLRVTNVGEIEGYASKVVDYIPEDFILVKSNAWSQEGNEAVTTSLADTLLEPGESVTINITFEWKLEEGKIGLRTNEGKIAEYENPYDAVDLTEDNNDKESFMVAVRTGAQTITIVMAIVIAASVGALAIAIKKRQ